MRMRIILSAAAALGAVALSACGGGSSGGPHHTKVVAAFYPLAYAAQQLGGRSVEVENLTPPGAEPHDLEVTPSDVRDVQSADLVLLLGHGFQPQLEKAAGRGSRIEWL